jgi:hypothetical protein
MQKEIYHCDFCDKQLTDEDLMKVCNLPAYDRYVFTEEGEYVKEEVRCKQCWEKFKKTEEYKQDLAEMQSLVDSGWFSAFLDDPLTFIAEGR